MTSTYTSERITAIDGYVLGAHLYHGSSRESPATVGIINAGAGLRQRYYAPFAEYLAEAGIPTLTYDYRGIGASRPATMRGFRATVEDWGSKDCAAVVNWMRCRFPGARLAIIGHSVGALVTGFVTNGQFIDKFVMVGGHTGYWGDYDRRLRPLMFVAWHVIMPLVTSVVGYFPGKRLRIGDDLPAGAALQWAARLKPELWWNVRDRAGMPDAVRIAEVRSRFAALRAEILAMRFVDDAFATEAATDRLTALFEHCHVSRESLVPSEFRLRHAGHFAFFKRDAAQSAWVRVGEWLNA